MKMFITTVVCAGFKIYPSQRNFSNILVCEMQRLTFIYIPLNYWYRMQRANYNGVSNYWLLVIGLGPVRALTLSSHVTSFLPNAAVTRFSPKHGSSGSSLMPVPHLKVFTWLCGIKNFTPQCCACWTLSLFNSDTSTLLGEKVNNLYFTHRQHP